MVQCRLECNRVVQYNINLRLPHHDDYYRSQHLHIFAIRTYRCNTKASRVEELTEEATSLKNELDAKDSDLDQLRSRLDAESAEKVTSILQ